MPMPNEIPSKTSYRWTDKNNIKTQASVSAYLIGDEVILRTVHRTDNDGMKFDHLYLSKAQAKALRKQLKEALR